MKKVLALTMVLAILFCFAGCSDSTVGSSKEESTTDSTTALTTGTTKSETTEVYISNNETVTNKNVCEFYIESSNITNVIEPPYPDNNSYYYIYEAESGQTFVDVIIAYKNLSSVGIKANKTITGATLVYDKSYKYNPSLTIEENGRSDFAMSIRTAEIAPLTVGYLHLVFQVPQEVENTSSPIEVYFAINNTKYCYIVR